MDKIFKWIVLSSADPKRTSATIQGLLLANLGAGLMTVSHLGTQIIGAISTLIGGLLMAFGIVRKVYLQIKSAAQSLK